MKRILLTLLLITPLSFADFSCEVKDMKMLNDDGSLKTPPNPWRVGDVFVVDKLTGDVMPVLNFNSTVGQFEGYESLLRKSLESLTLSQGQ
jgi:hypothetical protein